jgi:hypothetical protein
MKHVRDTQWEKAPTQERLAATWKRTLRSATARSARSVWSECRSRVTESRKSVDRPGLPVCVRGGGTDPHTIRRPGGAQARCGEAGPGAESRAEAYGGILRSWERPHRSHEDSRKRATPANKRPGTGVADSAAPVSENEETSRGPVSEANRSEREDGGGSRSGPVVVLESRRTETGGSL